MKVLINIPDNIANAMIELGKGDTDCADKDIYAQACEAARNEITDVTEMQSEAAGAKNMKTLMLGYASAAILTQYKRIEAAQQ